MRRMLALVCWGTLTSGCAFDPLAPPVDAPLVSGAIVAVAPDLGPLPPGTITRLHIQPFSADCGVVFDITGDTDILVIREGESRRGEPRDLVLSVSASGWTEGAVSRSCPGLATASFIEVNHDIDSTVDGP